MSTLQGRQESNTFGDLTHIENSNNGFDAILRVLESGNGNASSLSLSTISAQFSGTLGVTGVATFDVTPNVNGDDIWHAGNDGPGSGLDADTLDGFEATTIPIGSRNVTVTGNWDWQSTLTFTRATSALIRRDIQSDGDGNEMTSRFTADEWQVYPSPAGDDSFTSRFSYDFNTDNWRMGGEGLGLDNGSSINFRNAADNGFITAFSIDGTDNFTLGDAGSDINIVGTNVTFNGTAPLSASANEVITGSWDYQQGSNNSTALQVTSTIVGQEYYLKWNVVTEGIRFLPGLVGDADYPSSELKYNGDNDQWELGSGDGLLLKTVPTLYLENLAQTGSFTALGVAAGDQIKVGDATTSLDIIGTTVTINGSSIGGFDMSNNQFLTGEDTGVTARNLIGVNGSDLLQIGDTTGPSGGMRQDAVSAYELYVDNTRMIRTTSSATLLYDPSHGRVAQTQNPTSGDNVSGLHVEDASNALRPVGFADRTPVSVNTSADFELTKEHSVQTLYIESGTPNFQMPAFDGDHPNGAEWWIYNETANQASIDPREFDNTLVYLDGSTGEQGGLYLNGYGWVKITKKADETYFARGVGLQVPTKILDNATNTNSLDLDIREVNDSGAETDSSGYESIAAFSSFQRAPGSGAFQFEVFIEQDGVAQSHGLIDDDATILSGAFPGSNTVGSDALSYNTNGTVYYNLDGSGETQDTAPATYTTGDYIQVVVDWDNNSIDFYKNGTLQSQVDITGITFNGGLTPVLCCNGSGSRATLNLEGPFNNTIAGTSSWA